MKAKLASIDLGSEFLQEQILKAATLFRENGVLQIKSFYSKEYLHELKSEFDLKYRYYFKDKVYEDALSVGDKRTMLTLSFEGLFSQAEYYLDDRLRLLMNELLGRSYIVHSLGAVISLPGAKEQGVHQDNPNAYAQGGEEMLAKGPPYAITVGIPLVKTDEVCGGTRFWPGTHLRVGPIEQSASEDGIRSCGDLGSIILFDYRIYHQGLANNSDIIRPMLYNVYSRPWFRDTSNYLKQEYMHLSNESFESISAEDKGLFSWLFEDH